MKKAHTAMLKNAYLNPSSQMNNTPITAVKYKDCEWVKVYNTTVEDAESTFLIDAYRLEDNTIIEKEEKKNA